ncbi:MAG: GxxExxY protein [Spirochaetales bacterium]|nr:GxxExxY protein [Spirochaetales bacterium]
MNTIIQKEFSDLVVDLAFTVHKALGPGLLESAYEEALCWEFRHAGIPFTRQHVYPLIYKGDYISSYIADLVLDNKVILEIKSVKKLNELMQAQLINYLKLSKIPVGYLLNFNAVRLEFQRFVNSSGL